MNFPEPFRWFACNNNNDGNLQSANPVKNCAKLCTWLISSMTECVCNYFTAVNAQRWSSGFCIRVSKNLQCGFKVLKHKCVLLLVVVSLALRLGLSWSLIFNIGHQFACEVIEKVEEGGLHRSNFTTYIHVLSRHFLKLFCNKHQEDCVSP